MPCHIQSNIIAACSVLRSSKCHCNKLDISPLNLYEIYDRQCGIDWFVNDIQCLFCPWHFVFFWFKGHVPKSWCCVFVEWSSLRTPAEVPLRKVFEAFANTQHQDFGTCPSNGICTHHSDMMFIFVGLILSSVCVCTYSFWRLGYGFAFAFWPYRHEQSNANKLMRDCNSTMYRKGQKVLVHFLRSRWVS